MKREKLNLVVLFAALLFSNVLAQQDETAKVSLLNYDEVESYLNLSLDQQNSIKPLVKEIVNIKEQDEKAFKELRSKMQSMGKRDPSMREKMMEERSQKQNKIDGLIKQIEQLLNKDQLEKFNKIEKPNLMSNSKRMN